MHESTMHYSLGDADHEQHARNHNALDLLRNSSYLNHREKQSHDELLYDGNANYERD